MELSEHLRSAGAAGLSDLSQLEEQLIGCRRCPRLVSWREEVAATKRASFADEAYWGRPVPGFGDPGARLLVLGLAPGAHGANRTGRMFTGDRSGDWLYRAMHRAGFATQAESTRRGDGLALIDAFVTAPVKCVPPANKPDASERDACASWLDAELELLNSVAVVVVLGGYSYASALRAFSRRGAAGPRPRVPFRHGGEVALEGGPVVLMSYHPSQQNTFTGRLTEAMLDDVFSKARRLLDDA